MHTRHITIISLVFALAASGDALAKKKTDRSAKKPAKAKKAKKASDSESSDALWFEAPIVTPDKEGKKEPKAKKKAKKKKARDAKKGSGSRYGLSLKLGEARSSRQAPRVEERATDLSRKLHKNEIQRVIRGQRNSISFCTRAAAKKGERASQVLLHFRVDSKGSAGKVAVTRLSGKPLEVMTRCMRRAAKRWQFPADTAGGDFEYPLMLNRR